MCVSTFFSVLLYMFFQLLNISTLDELFDSQQVMDISICLIIEGRWFKVVCINRSVVFEQKINHINLRKKKIFTLSYEY